MAGTLDEDQCTFMIISCRILLEMRNVSGQNCRENQNTRFVFNNILFQNRAVYEIMWKNIVQPNRSQTIIGTCALHAGYLRLQTHTHNK